MKAKFGGMRGWGWWWFVGCFNSLATNQQSSAVLLECQRFWKHMNVGKFAKGNYNYVNKMKHQCQSFWIYMNVGTLHKEIVTISTKWTTTCSQILVTFVRSVECMCKCSGSWRVWVCFMSITINLKLMWYNCFFSCLMILYLLTCMPKCSNIKGRVVFTRWRFGCTHYSFFLVRKSYKKMCATLYHNTLIGNNKQKNFPTHSITKPFYEVLCMCAHGISFVNSFSSQNLYLQIL